MFCGNVALPSRLQAMANLIWYLIPGSLIDVFGEVDASTNKAARRYIVTFIYRLFWCCVKAKVFRYRNTSSDYAMLSPLCDAQFVAESLKWCNRYQFKSTVFHIRSLCLWKSSVNLRTPQLRRQIPRHHHHLSSLWPESKDFQNNYFVFWSTLLSPRSFAYQDNQSYSRCVYTQPSNTLHILCTNTDE